MNCSVLAATPQSQGIKIPVYLETTFLHPGWVEDETASTLLSSSSGNGKAPYARVAQTIVIDSSETDTSNGPWQLALYQNGPIRNLRCRLEKLVQKDSLSNKIIDSHDDIDIEHVGKDAFSLRISGVEEQYFEPNHSPTQITLNKNDVEGDNLLIEEWEPDGDVSAMDIPFTKLLISGKTARKNQIIRFSYDKLPEGLNPPKDPVERYSFRINCASNVSSLIGKRMNKLRESESSIADVFAEGFEDLSSRRIVPKHFFLFVAPVPSTEFDITPSVYTYGWPGNSISQYQVVHSGDGTTDSDKTWTIDSFVRKASREGFSVEYKSSIKPSLYSRINNTELCAHITKALSSRLKRMKEAVSRSQKEVIVAQKLARKTQTRMMDALTEYQKLLTETQQSAQDNNEAVMTAFTNYQNCLQKEFENAITAPIPKYEGPSVFSSRHEYETSPI